MDDMNATLIAARKRIAQARETGEHTDKAWLLELLSELADEAEALAETVAILMDDDAMAAIREGRALATTD